MTSRCIYLCLTRLTWIILLAMLSVEASAGISESELLGERPSENGEPTVVEVGLFVIDIDEIDDVTQRFNVDMFIVARWKDSRLALPEAEREGHERFMSIDDVWTPRILFLNDRGLTPQLRVGVTIDDLGNVRFQNRLSGELSANLEFLEFPFDVQRLPIDMVSYQYTAEELQLSSNSDLTSEAEKFSIEGWHMKELEPEIGVFMLPTSNVKLPRLTYIIEARRDSDYYVLTMLVPMALIIFMAWTVFWLQPNIVPSRIAISTASIFSLIALGVSIRLGLPKVSYLTRADIFVLGCTLMVFVALGVAVIGSRWANSDRMELALKTNAIARWVYLLLFAVVTFVAFYR
ncbi:hypothetical protein ACFL0N_01895 [Pseudomonadota bacterium]